MANLWRLRQTIVIDNLDSITWPAVLKVEFDLEPADFFERNEATPVKTSIHGESTLRLHGVTGKVTVEKTGLAPAFDHEIIVPEGIIAIRGNKAFVNIQAADFEYVNWFVDWVQIVLSQFLSVKLGVYCASYFIDGSIADQKFGLIYKADVYNITLHSSHPDERFAFVDDAFKLVDWKSQSFLRYTTCCLYFQHALRLTSPYQVEFPPYSAIAEVLLNLAKCIEYLFSCSKRDDLRKRLASLGYDTEQIESQLISIIVVRNEIDVGHPMSGMADDEEIAVLRKFASRSVDNVKALLNLIAKKISENPQFLAPISLASSKDSKKLIKNLAAHLAKPAL